MRDTRADMKDKYKETSRGGLALNVVECQRRLRASPDSRRSMWSLGDSNP
jgi:hypothetical protein